jgi:hypothetical protein
MPGYLKWQVTKEEGYIDVEGDGVCRQGNLHLERQWATPLSHSLPENCCSLRHPHKRLSALEFRVRTGDLWERWAHTLVPFLTLEPPHRLLVVVDTGTLAGCFVTGGFKQ